jgi:hypothetical protein
MPIAAVAVAGLLAARTRVARLVRSFLPLGIGAGR